MFAASGFWVFLPFFIPGLLADACYHVNGDAIKDPAYVPCNLITPGVASSCCPTKRADFPSVCLANGLCSNDNDIFRGSCTDKTWKSKSCPQLCTTGFGQRRQDVGDPVGATNWNYSQKDVRLTPCRDGSFCCGWENTTCCDLDQGNRLNIPTPIPTSISPSSTLASLPTIAGPLANVNTTTSASGNTTAASKNKKSNVPDQQIIIGVALGCGVLGFIMVACMIWYFLVRQWHPSPKAKRLKSLSAAEPEYMYSIYELDSRDPPPTRVVINSRRHEMGAGEVVPELHGNKRESARRTRRWTARLGAWMS